MKSDFSVSVETSQVRVLDRWWPACCLILPQRGDFDAERDQRMLGSYGCDMHNREIVNQIEVYVPSESGALVHLDYSMKRPFSDWSLTMSIDSRFVALEKYKHETEPRLWLPFDVAPKNGTLVPGHIFWRNCDLEWANETIERVTKMPLIVPDEVMQRPKLELISLKEGWEIQARIVAWSKAYREAHGSERG